MGHHMEDIERFELRGGRRTERNAGLWCDASIGSHPTWCAVGRLISVRNEAITRTCQQMICCVENRTNFGGTIQF